MAAVNTCSDFGVQENKTCYCFPFSLLWSDGNGSHDLRFLNVEFQASFFHSPLSPSSRGPVLHFVPLEWYHLHIWGCWYFSRQSWFQLVFSSGPVFLMMYSAYNLNKQGDNIQLWHTPFPIWNQSVVPCPVLTVASDPHSDFSRGRLGFLVFPSLSEFSTVYCDPYSQRLWHSQ